MTSTDSARSSRVASRRTFRALSKLVDDGHVRGGNYEHDETLGASSCRGRYGQPSASIPRLSLQAPTAASALAGDVSAGGMETPCMSRRSAA